jgi:hypothetical protein
MLPYPVCEYGNLSHAIAHSLMGMRSNSTANWKKNPGEVLRNVVPLCMKITCFPQKTGSDNYYQSKKEGRYSENQCC